MKDSTTGSAASRPVAAVECSKWAEVDPAAIRDNAAEVARAVGPDVRVMAMVKADGYGHGAALAATAALEGGASWLGVSSAEEALHLRREGFRAPLLITGWVPPARVPELVEAQVQMTVWSAEQIAAATRAGGRVPAQIHLKIDTGMGRLGCAPEAVPGLADAIDRARTRLRPVGALTHFAAADSDASFTRLQDRTFMDAVLDLRRRWPDLIVHAANSAAALGLPETRHSLVRIGIALYGYPPAGAAPTVSLRPAMSFHARITEVKTVPPGQSVGYGRTWIAERGTRVATIAAGYADGVHRAQSSRGCVLVGGCRCPIIGRVSMDQITADISATSGVRAGDEAVLFGRQGDQWLGADEVGAAVGTISYEVLCSVSGRVPRLSLA